MNPKHPLFCGHAEAEGEAIVAGAAMHVQTIGAAGPEAVVRHRNAKDAKKGPRKAKAHKPNLTAVSVA